MPTNKKLGNTFETEFCEILFDRGFWVHNMAQNAAGQPADVIAVKNGKAYLIDCKVCSSDTFALSRIEANQSYAMCLWDMAGNGKGWFAFKICEHIIMIDYLLLNHLSLIQSRLTKKDFVKYGVPLGEWIDKCE